MKRNVTRRSLLLGASSLVLTQLVSSCLSRPQATQFSVEFLASSIPVTLLKQFQSTLQSTTALKAIPLKQLAESQLLASLPTEQSQTQPSLFSPWRYLPWGQAQSPNLTLPNITSLGDGWLQNAIQTKRIQPLMLASSSGWEQLPSVFQTLVRRNNQGIPDESGSIWAAPYRWGHLMMVYRVDKLKDKLGWVPTDWADLWDEVLRHRISLLDHERVVIGLVLKTLGQSSNTATLDRVNGLTDALETLHQQVKFYSSDTYLQPLLLDDTWVAVGWSTDILPLVRRDRRLAAIVPESGTLLTADLWVQPSVSTNPNVSTNPESMELDNQWIEFFWNPDVATQLSLLSTGASPIILAPDVQETLPSSLLNDTLLLPPATTLDASEFVMPLPEEAIAQYQHYWTIMRQR
ncbi:MAG: extracellular solute-binding protein [Merismopedia sp. SIO2A8]|nr:extracellular solute-binding protein [Merismopedia sp. SIO2A8]